MTNSCIGVLNAGSSSIKFALHDAAEDGAARLRGQIQGIGVKPNLVVRDHAGYVVLERTWPPEGFGHEAATRAVTDRIGPDVFGMTSSFLNPVPCRQAGVPTRISPTKAIVR